MIVKKMSPKGGYVIGIVRIHFDADEEFEESPFKVEWQTDMTILEWYHRLNETCEYFKARETAERKQEEI